MIEIAIIVSLIIGTLYGLFVGFKRGVMTGSSILLNSLITDGYVKTTEKNGELVLIRHPGNVEES